MIFSIYIHIWPILLLSSREAEPSRHLHLDIPGKPQSQYIPQMKSSSLPLNWTSFISHTSRYGNIIHLLSELPLLPNFKWPLNPSAFPPFVLFSPFVPPHSRLGSHHHLSLQLQSCSFQPNFYAILHMQQIPVVLRIKSNLLTYSLRNNRVWPLHILPSLSFPAFLLDHTLQLQSCHILSGKCDSALPSHFLEYPLPLFTWPIPTPSPRFCSDVSPVKPLQALIPLK